MSQSRLGLGHILGGLGLVSDRKTKRLGLVSEPKISYTSDIFWLFPISGSALELQMQNLYDRDLLS
jgi:hypothetical protein